jgi:2-keto-4-pentenoate hydratase/2-oxohepta-3-ene-1,7-dioic acid hydratase in catechol pathway
MKNPSWNETKSQLNSQNYPISGMIFSAQELVSKISHDMTLLPGDLIAAARPSASAERDRTFERSGIPVVRER